MKPPAIDIGFDSLRGGEAGESGDFYGLDYGVKRVLRISPAGRIVKVVAFAGLSNAVVEMRVSEAAGALYLLAQDSQVHAIGLDGVERWKQAVPWGWHAVWTVDAAGALYVMDRGVKRWNADGAALPDVKLEAGAGSQARLRARRMRWGRRR